MQIYGVENKLPYTFQELASPAQIKNLIDQNATDPDTQAFFGMSEEDIKKALGEVEFSSRGFDVSPGFQSPGYGSSYDVPVVKLPDIIPAGIDQIGHEFNHALHYTHCKSLFEGEHWGEAVSLFRDNVLGDDDFTKYTLERGFSGQKIMISTLRSLLGKIDITPDYVKLFAWQLGAITYQHAWFVDPGMIEAVGSFKNQGVFLKANLNLNHWFGRLFLPGQDVFEGYQDTQAQELFSKASPFKKALLVKKRDYDRVRYFNNL